MYPSVNPGTNVFCAWPFLAFSCVSIETAANFRLFLDVAVILEEGKSSTVVKTELVLYSSNEMRFSTII